MTPGLRRIATPYLLVALLAGCAPPAPGTLSVSWWAPPAGEPSPLALHRPVEVRGTAALAGAEIMLLQGGWTDAGSWQVTLAELPAWDEAAARCPRRDGPGGIGLCRLWPPGSRDLDHVLVDAGGRTPWLLLLPPAGPEGPVDLIDTGRAALILKGAQAHP